MKVSGGLVGITSNPIARTKSFLNAPELSRLAGEAQQMAELTLKSPNRHHDLSNSTSTHQDKALEELTSIPRSFTNPFTEQRP